LLTRTGPDWTRKYPAIANALSYSLPRQAYRHGESCGIGPKHHLVHAWGLIIGAAPRDEALNQGQDPARFRPIDYGRDTDNFLDFLGDSPVSF